MKSAIYFWLQQEAIMKISLVTYPRELKELTFYQTKGIVPKNIIYKKETLNYRNEESSKYTM